MRLLTLGIAAAAVIGAGIGIDGRTCVPPGPGLVVFTAPLPRDPAPHPPSAPDLPTADRVARILTALADPDISDQAKTDLVQGGIGSDERRAFNHDRLAKAAKHGELPLSFTVGNIWPVGPNTAAAQVTVGGPKRTPVTKVLTFIDQGGWRLSSDSAATLIQAVARD